MVPNFLPWKILIEQLCGAPSPELELIFFLRKPCIAKYPLRSFLIHFSQKKIIIDHHESILFAQISPLIFDCRVGPGMRKFYRNGMELSDYRISAAIFFIYYQIRRKVTGPEPDSPLTRISGPTLTEY